MPASLLSRRHAIVALFALALAGPAAAQNWPERPIRMVVGFAPGGFTDVLARLIGQKLGSRLGQTGGGREQGGCCRHDRCRHRGQGQPDGYTLLLAHSNSNSVAPALYPKLPYDVLKDFTPIVRVATTPLLLTVNPAVTATDVKSFIELAKSKPQGAALRVLRHGSCAAPRGRALHARDRHQDDAHSLQGQLGQAIVDLLAGQVELNFESPPNVLKHAEAGQAACAGDHQRQALAVAARRCRRWPRQACPMPRCCSGSRCMGPARLPPDDHAEAQHRDQRDPEAA